MSMMVVMPMVVMMSVVVMMVMAGAARWNDFLVVVVFRVGLGSETHGFDFQSLTRMQAMDENARG